MSASLARQACYAVAAVLGLTITWSFNLAYTGDAGYLQAWFANEASSSAAVDLIIVSLAASVFMVVEGRRLGMRLPVLYVVLGFVGAMACAVPLFLLVRERTLQTTLVA